MKRAEVSIIQSGRLSRDADGAVLDAHSTVTLIRTRRQLILVDTGAPEDGPHLVEALRSENISPSQITLVINSHGHRDHVGGNDLFPAARFVAHAAEPQITRIFPAGAPFTLVRAPRRVDHGVMVLPTPGHSPGSLSVVVSDPLCRFEGGGGTVVIAGDAIPLRANYLMGVPPALHWDIEASRKSMAAITSLADWVIPGHDHPFRVQRNNSV